MSTNPTPPETFGALHQAEYERLRREIGQAVRQAYWLERCAVVVTAAVWSWLAPQGAALPQAYYWIPALVAVLSALRCLALLVSIRQIATYLRSIEAAFARKDLHLQGWETSTAVPGGLLSLILGDILFWTMLIGVTIVAPFLVVVR